MKVIVCGGRDFDDRDHAFKALYDFHVNKALGGITEVAHGGAKGADSLAQYWSESHGIPVRVFQANWKKHGRAAGPIRNKVMLDNFEPDAVIAFDGGRGTRDMTDRADAIGVPVFRL